jgi:NADH-quinone oxidoreductase subunit M
MINLVLLLAFPFAAALLVLACTAFSHQTQRRIAVALSLLPIALLIWGGYSWLQAKIDVPWLPIAGIKFHVAIDFMTLLFLALTVIIIPISIIATPVEQLRSPSFFYALVFVLEGLLFGFFTSRDLALFTIFWEAMLLPLYFMISYWGGYKRQQAALKFLIYMIAGSTLMIAAVLALYFASSTGASGGSFDFDILSKIAATLPHIGIIAAIFFLAFAVKTPLFPFHAWLPDAYYTAPLGGTILLSALLSKAGIYGFLRIGVDFFPQQIEAWSPLLLGLAIIGVFYGGLAAWSQNDYKRLIAYSSLSHVNFILIGIFALNHVGLTGALLQAINHGLTIAALFLVAGWVQQRAGSYSIGQLGGVVEVMPRLCWLTVFFVIASVALPGLNNFIGEWLIFVSLFKKSAWLAGILVLSVILSAMYMLRWLEKGYFGNPKAESKHWDDIGTKEFIIAMPLVVLILFLGIYPAPLIDQIDPAMNQLIATTSTAAETAP